MGWISTKREADFGKVVFTGSKKPQMISFAALHAPASGMRCSLHCPPWHTSRCFRSNLKLSLPALQLHGDFPGDDEHPQDIGPYKQGLPEKWMLERRESPIFSRMMTGGTPILRNPHIIPLSKFYQHQPTRVNTAQATSADGFPSESLRTSWNKRVHRHRPPEVCHLRCQMSNGINIQREMSYDYYI